MQQKLTTTCFPEEKGRRSKWTLLGSIPVEGKHRTLLNELNTKRVTCPKMQKKLSQAISVYWMHCLCLYIRFCRRCRKARVKWRFSIGTDPSSWEKILLCNFLAGRSHIACACFAFLAAPPPEFFDRIGAGAHSHIQILLTCRYSTTWRSG